MPGSRDTASRARNVATAAVIAGVGLLLLAGCGTSSHASTTGSPSTTAAGSPGTRPATNLPRIIVVLEENHSYAQIIGASTVPGLNALAAQGTVLTNYFAITHPSLPNYLALISGSTQGITSDCGRCNVDAPSLATQLSKAGISWKVYAQGLPRACSRDTPTSGDYAKKHVPFLYFTSIRDNAAECAHVVPFARFAADANAGKLPTFVFITPDLAHDMHGVGEGKSDTEVEAAADQFAARIHKVLQGSPAWQQDTRLVITWDEGAGGNNGAATGCCNGLATGGHIATIILGPKVAVGHDATTYSHYSLLRSIETRYGLALLGHAADAVVAPIPAITAH